MVSKSAPTTNSPSACGCDGVPRPDPLPSGSRTKLGESISACRRTPPPVESRQPDSSTRGRAADAARGRRPRQIVPKRARTPDGGSARQGLKSKSRAWPHAGRCTRSHAVDLDGHEATKAAPSPSGHCGRHVRAPHHIGGRGGDRAVVRLRAVRVAHAVRGLEVVLPHQPTHPFQRGADPRDPELRPGFPVPFAVKGRGFEQSADVAGQHVVRGGADRPTPPTRRPGRPVACRRAYTLDTVARCHTTADPLHALRPPRGDRAGVLHRLDLRRAKGPPTSNWSTVA